MLSPGFRFSLHTSDTYHWEILLLWRMGRLNSVGHTSSCHWTKLTNDQITNQLRNSKIPPTLPKTNRRKK